MKRCSALLIAVLLAGAVSLPGCEEGKTAGKAKPPAEKEGGSTTAALGEKAPEFTLEDQDGKKVSLSDYAGKIVVLEWVNPQCPFVRYHYKQGTMQKLADKYKDVVWLAIDSSHTMTKKGAQDWIAEHKLTYPTLDDHAGTVGKLYGAKTTPHMFIIDKAGVLVYMGGIDDSPMGEKKEKAIPYVDNALAEVTAGKAVAMPDTKPYGCSVKYK